MAPSDSVLNVARLDPKHPLTAQELMLRAHTLSDAGHTDEALRAVDGVAAAPGTEKVSELDRIRARGTTFFARAAAGAKPQRRSRSAPRPVARMRRKTPFTRRVRSRARIETKRRLVSGYEEVARRYPKSTWADDAAFFMPYLRMLHAEWQRCASGFDKLSSRSPNRRAHARGAARRWLVQTVRGDTSKGRGPRSSA